MMLNRSLPRFDHDRAADMAYDLATVARLDSDAIVAALRGSFPDASDAVLHRAVIAARDRVLRQLGVCPPLGIKSWHGFAALLAIAALLHLAGVGHALLTPF